MKTEEMPVLVLKAIYFGPSEKSGIINDAKTDEKLSHLFL